MLSLTEKVIRYQETGAGLREITEEILVTVYRYPRVQRGFSEDDCGEFCLHFYPRIERILSRFTYTGLPFEAYLASNVRWQFKSYAAFRRSRERLQTVRNLELLVEFRQQQRRKIDETNGCGCDSGTVPQWMARAFHLAADGTPRSPVVAKRLFILAMKGCCELDDDQLVVVANMTGEDPEQTVEFASALRESMTRRERRAAKLRERRNRAFLKLRMLQDRRDITPDGEGTAELDRQIVNTRMRLKMARLCLSRVPRHPTHDDLARIMSIPRGTVDSSLYYLRQALERAGHAIV